MLPLFAGIVLITHRELIAHLLNTEPDWPVRFRIQQVGDQFAVGDEHDPGEQRQHVGQRVGVTPVSGRKNTCDLPKLGGDP